MITAVEEHRHFFPTIEFERDGQLRVLEERRSDAIALALRAHDAGIYVAEPALRALGMPAERGTSPITETPAVDHHTGRRRRTE